MSTSARKRTVEKQSEPAGPTVKETLSRALTSEAKWTDKVFISAFFIILKLILDILYRLCFYFLIPYWYFVRVFFK